MSWTDTRSSPTSPRDLRFSRREVFDLALAWVALGIAFALFFSPGLRETLLTAGPSALGSSIVQWAIVRSMATAGIGFLLHELAHKVVAVRFGQLAEFRADYGMLALAILSAFAGFLFAAPGAVYHRGWISERQNGLIALAGPAMNVALAVVFAPLAILGDGSLAGLGGLGVSINLLLAGFNMLPFGPLDGRKVFGWSKLVFAVAFVLTAVPAVFVLVSFVFM